MTKHIKRHFQQWTLMVNLSNQLCINASISNTKSVEDHKCMWRVSQVSM